MKKIKNLYSRNQTDSDSRIFNLLSKLKTSQRKLRELKSNQQKNVLIATLAAQERERYNISRALHDSVCQILYGIKLNLQSIPEFTQSDLELDNINNLLDQAIKETRDISYALTPSVLKDFGFIAAVNEMTGRLSTKFFKVQSIISPSMDNLTPVSQLYYFRIIQELVNNCIKHSFASKVLIIAKEEGENINITVEDNGKGFKANALKTLKNESGLRSIKNQIFLLNGDLTFKITKNGTTASLICSKNVELSE